MTGPWQAFLLVGISVVAAGAEVPDWLGARLREEPTVASGLVRVLAFEQVGEGAEAVGQVTVAVSYLDITGQPKEGQARLFVRESDIAQGKDVPGLMFAHYEADPGGGAHWARRGWAVVTTHANGEHCLGNSFNLDLALLEWLRRLPFVDRRHVAIAGGSAGGYMTLAMAAEGFPLVAAAPDVPVANWAYNAAYLVKNAPLAAKGVPPGGDWKESPLPVLLVVVPIATDAQKLFGEDLSLKAWEQVSPVSYLDRITCPVSLTCSTADMLVPMPQFSKEHTIPPEASAFPEGFETRIDVLTEIPAMRRPMLDRLSARKRTVFVHKVPRDYHELDPLQVLAGGQQPKPPPPLDRPWDPRKQWSIVIFDEGAPTPKTGHFRYQFGQSADSFMAHYREAPPRVEALNRAKLRRLMERYVGKLSDAPTLRLAGTEPRPIHRLNYEPLERLDVVTGLLDYAECGTAFEARLKALYRGLPKGLKALGPGLDVQRLRAMGGGLRQDAARRR